MVHYEVIVVFSNWASVWRNHPSSESNQTIGILLEKVVSRTGSGFVAALSLGITTEIAEKKRNKLSNHQNPTLIFWCEKHRDLVETNFKYFSERFDLRLIKLILYIFILF